MLLDGGEDQRADLGYRATAVRIHPDDGAATTRFLNRGRGPQADVARHREDDVSALRNEILAYRLPLGLVGEVPTERSILFGGIPPEHLDVLPGVLVVLEDSRSEPVLEDRDRWDVDSSKRPHLAGLGHPGGQIPGQEGRVVRLEGQAQHIRKGTRLIAEVDDLEVHVGIRLGRVRRRLVQPESHCHDHLRVLL